MMTMMTRILWMLGVCQSSAPGNNDSNRNNNNHEEQEESDATQQYPNRTREQVVNDKYILEQQKAASHQVMEVELRVEKRNTNPRSSR